MPVGDLTVLLYSPVAGSTTQLERNYCKSVMCLGKRHPTSIPREDVTTMQPYEIGAYLSIALASDAAGL